ncbi:MAG: permease-like cell division protein FtsX [Candidatus Neomarinimicrobiota bacterium]
MKLLFIIKQTFSNLWRERTPVIATILTICIALTILVAIFEISFILFNQLEDLKSNTRVEVYIESDLSNSTIQNIKTEIEDIISVQDVKFISKDMAADIFNREFGEDIMEILGENPLPVTFEIRLYQHFNNPDYLLKFKEKVEEIRGVEEVHYRHALIAKLEALTQAVATAGIIMLVILFIAMHLLIRNTVKLSVYARHQQIQIMKNLGAGTIFIRLPFILEGAIEGLIGGILSSIFLIFAHKFAESTFSLLVFPHYTYKLIALITISAGIAIGFITSAGSVSVFVNKIFSKK